MICLVGKSCSGKSVLAKEIESTYDFERVITCTTRPIREGEVDGADYHFLTEEVFMEKVYKGEFAEFKSYNTEYGLWRYGTLKSSLLGENVIVVDLDGLKAIKNCSINNVVSFYILAPDEVLLERQLERKDDKAEALRRFEADKKDFEGAEEQVDFVILNDGRRSLELLAEIIVTAYEGKMNDRRK